MKYIFLFLGLFTSSVVAGQQNVVLEIQHMLKDTPFAFNKASENNMGHAFTLRRMDYYLSAIEVIHDGGKKISFPNLYVLVSLDENQEKTIINLGSHPLQNIEKINFFLGIDSLTNHSDPAIWQIGHPLGPRIPSMHWGWASGYRFIALEGKGGPANNQEIQLHALGNQYYKQMSFDVTPFGENNEKRIILTADYTELFYQMPIKQGVIVHGSDKEIVYLADNFINRLFSAQTPTSLNAASTSASITISPNPSQGSFTASFTGNHMNQNWRTVLTDTNGRVIAEKRMSDSENWLITVPGVYFLRVYQDDGKSLDTKKVVIY